MNLISRRPRRGFTLIELLVVITVIAIISGIAVTRVGNVEQEARLATSISNLADVQRTIDASVVRNKGKLPNGFDSLLDSTDNTQIYPGNGVATQNGGVYASWLTAGNLTTGEFISLARNLVPATDGSITLNLYDHDPTATDANASTDPSTIRAEAFAFPVTATPAVAIVNPGTTGDPSAVYQALNLDPDDTTFRIVALGLGPQCTMIGDRVAGLQEAPLIEDIAPNQQYGYHRAIVLVRVQDAGAYFAEVVGVVTSYGKNTGALRTYLP